MSQKMIQPEPDKPCQWCGRTEHEEPIVCRQGNTCSHCGGVHWGSHYCPYSETQEGREERKPWPITEMGIFSETEIREMCCAAWMAGPRTRIETLITGMNWAVLTASINAKAES